MSHEIIANKLTKSEAIKMEVAMIKSLKTQNQKYGYNLSSGGESGSKGTKWTPEQRAKKSAS